MIPLLDAALHLAGAIVDRIPEPDPAVRRARLIGRWSGIIARLEAIRAHRRLTPAEAGRLARTQAALEELQELSR